VFLGDGQKKEALQNMVTDYGLKNVSIIGPQPLETIPYFLKAADVLIESLKEVSVAKMAFPSKMFEYMASGHPVIFGSRRGEAIEELRLAGGALTYPSDSPEALGELVLKLRAGEIDHERLGRQYRDHIIKHHQREMWAEQYLTFLNNI
jgi:glycosyltransferase involved in cell wall biosynthesis